MGNRNKNDSRKFPELDDLIQEYRRLVSKCGEPLRLCVVNEDRLNDFKIAASIVRAFVSESKSKLDFEVTFGEEDKSVGYIEVRGYYWAIENDDFFADLQYAEELANSIEFGVSDESKFIYTLGFTDLMTVRKMKMR